MSIRVNYNCGKSAGTTKYISLDRRFKDQRVYNTIHDIRINAKKRARNYRNSRHLIPQFTLREWLILAGLLFLIFITYCSIVYK